MIIKKIISGGQTGADRGGLDAAIELGIEHGGFCPKGRLAEDGEISIYYSLTETESDKYPPRTVVNIKSSDATLVISSENVFDKGTALTLKIINESNKPYCKLNITVEQNDKQIYKLCEWLKTLSTKLNREIVINVAGPRESRVPGLQLLVKDFLITVIRKFES